MVKRKEFPDVGDLVVCTVKEVKGFGAFVTLDEYPGREGFIHIAEVASGWVKYVRDHVRESQKIVCKVLNIDRAKGHIDLSLKRVNEHQRREKINEWKNEQKAEKLFEIVAERAKKPLETCYQEFGDALLAEHGTMYSAFEAAVIHADDFASENEGPWVKVFTEVAAENIAVPFVHVTGYVELSCPVRDGVVHLRTALGEAGKTQFEDVKIEVQYMGAPRYRIRVRAPDYKVAEEELKKSAERAIQIIEKHKGTGSFVRTLDKEAPAA
ncbi:MAG: translation initiation factor IF-2 subunit alpha [Methanobacteriota archaeon]